MLEAVRYRFFCLLEQSEALMRSALFDAQTRIKELNIERERLKPHVLSNAQMTQKKQLQYKIREQTALIKWLREHTVAPSTLRQKEATIAKLERLFESQTTDAQDERAKRARQKQEMLDKLKEQLAEKNAV